jgi:hypothetical protein
MELDRFIRLTHSEAIAARYRAALEQVRKPDCSSPTRYPGILRLRILVRPALKTGVITWGTKSFEFWSLLVVALGLIRPRSVVEFGSGRSTSYLTEYAMKEGIPFASIEQNRIYARRIKRGLRNSFLDDRYVHHVPLDRDGWYRQRALDRFVPVPCECLFIDGPVGSQDALGPGERDGARAREWLVAAGATSKLLIVDDVQRQANRALLGALVGARPDLDTRYLAYEPHTGAKNVVALAASQRDIRTLSRIGSQTGLELVTWPRDSGHAGVENHLDTDEATLLGDSVAGR